MGMEMRELGRTGLNVSRCCLGTMTWGSQNDQDDGFAQMDYALERGVNFFDTAEMYSVPSNADRYGRTETIIGNWFKARGNRDKVVLATKIIGRAPMVWSRPGMDVEENRITRAQVDLAVEQSLKRLQTDYIDLYQMHWPDRNIGLFGRHPGDSIFSDQDYEPFETILEALNAHVKKGNIRHIGVSNETSWGVMRFIAEAERRGLPRLASIQNAFSLVNRAFEGGLSEIAIREDVPLLAYSPLAMGFLTGKYSQGGETPKGSRLEFFGGKLPRYEGPGAWRAYNMYLDYARELDIDPTALALKFCDTRAFVGATIIGATTMTQLKANIDAFDLEWTPEMEARVNACHKEQPNPCL